MESEEPQRWTIDELAARVSAQISSSEIGQHSGRVSEVPSARTIRYYAKHGLVDPPEAYEGRTALYGRRHVVQLVAIKRLQAQGEKLSEIQRRLSGATEEKLERLAGMGDSEGSSDSGKYRGDESAFWRETPEESKPEHAEEQSPGSDDVAIESPGEGERSGALRGVRLGESAVILIENAARDPTPEDVEAIRAAAAPLEKVLERRNLVESDGEPRDEDDGR